MNRYPDTLSSAIDASSSSLPLRDGEESSERIAILVDSCTDVPREIAENHPVFTAALHVNYRQESYLDRVNITPQEVYDRLSTEIPTTSTPSVEQVMDLFQRIIKAGYTHVICIDISSMLSGTFDMIHGVGSNLDGVTVASIDTFNIGFGSGLVVLYACELLDRGFTFQEIVDKTRAIVPKTHTLFLVDTLEYLYKGGRINRAVYSLGSALNVKPIITCNEEGRYIVAGKARGRRKALEKAKELVARATKDQPFRLAVANGNAEDDASEILRAAAAEFPNARTIMDCGQISPVLTVHTGPGLIGLIFQTDYED